MTVVNVDGGPGAPSDASGSGETDLDVEQSGALAPGANVIVYQAPNSDPGFADAFFTAASENTADSVSTSWGEAETLLRASVASGTETPAYVAAFDEAFLELAAQGQSGFDAAGDAGAYDDSDELGTTNLDVDTPADSPFMTAAGGTTLPWTGQLTGPDGTVTVTVPHERTWGWDYLWQPIASVTGSSLLDAAEANIAGTGGGFSVLEPTPSYQQGVSGTHNFHAVQYLTPTNFQTVAPGLVEPTAWTINPTPGVSQGQGSGRAVPDLATNADPNSGYLLYEPSFAGVNEPVLQGRLGRHQLQRPAAERLDGGHRLLPGTPGRALEPIHLRLCRRLPLPVHPAAGKWHRQRQPLLHRQPRSAVQRGERPRPPQHEQAGGGLRQLRLTGP